ncbi:nucleoside hydrolase [Antarcticirhabdus aurantiaca]|uniref:Nucleoside hydrolase n=1 Tax=Antarcticirhabdus aurantiaca TaxID=2606717 RepID=A0ACD4NP72_9HYPH|nr:nucleoside hydrolase [Antarcticirhabdus aurantiaca]WAJ28656.1 nucleoside hydrolase [Jeongeuplla avenae]
MAEHAVIFDTDPGVDDALALLYLHRHRDVELAGITTVFGNAPIELTTRNALFLAERWGIAAPVARGAGECFDTRRPAGRFPTFIHGENGLGDIDVAAPARAPDPRPAHRFIADTLRARPGAITLVAVGRLTNLALALREAPEIAGLARGVVVMGGVFAGPGNVTPAAEANIHGDPEAADLVFGADWPVTIVGLDATVPVVMTRARLDALAQTGGEAARLVRDLSQDYIRFYETRIPDGMVVHDATACVALTDPALFRTRRGAVRVACEGLAAGMTIQKPDGTVFPPSAWDDRPSQTVCLGVEAEGVLSAIERTIAGD